MNLRRSGADYSDGCYCPSRAVYGCKHATRLLQQKAGSGDVPRVAENINKAIGFADCGVGKSQRRIERNKIVIGVINERQQTAIMPTP